MKSKPLTAEKGLTTIAVVGNINLDITTSRIPASPGITDDGETSIEEIHESSGGGGANTAVAAAIMGAKVIFCGCVGNDRLGERLVHHLRSMGVTPRVVTVPVSTGRSIAMSWDNGHRHFFSYLPNTAALDTGAVDVAALLRAGCRHLYRADVWFSSPMLFGGNVEVFQACRKEGMETSLDINWDPRWNSGLQNTEVRKRIGAVNELLPLTTFVHGNERELLSFCGSQTVDEAVRFLADRGVTATVVHRGSRGSAAFTDGAWTEVPAVAVPRIVSETGSGDVFTAAFLVHGGLPLPDRLREAGAAAARHLQGTSHYIPALAE